MHPTPHSVLDQDLAEHVRARLAQEGRLARSVLAVTVQEGIITVERTVASEYQRSLVTVTLNTIPGVLKRFAFTLKQSLSPNAFKS
jgi:osmotically-inducible protein OsmY